MNEPVLTLKNGVNITDEEGSHARVHGAFCWCGDGLIVAPLVFSPDHKKGDPVVVCLDHGHAGFRFKDLVKGRQENPNDPPQQPAKVSDSDRERINKLELASL